jgi:hypothetical protein
MGQKEMAMTGKKRPMIIGPKSDGVLAGAGTKEFLLGGK